MPASSLPVRAGALVLAGLLVACDDGASSAGDADADAVVDAVVDGFDVPPPNVHLVQPVSGLDPQRALSALTPNETAALCDRLALARQMVFSEIGLEYVCQFYAVANSQPLVAEQGLVAARTTCETMLRGCLAQAPRATCENHAATDLVDWAACGLTVGEVEACQGADNVHTLTSMHTATYAGLTCETFGAGSVTWLPDDEVGAACSAVDACE